MRGTTQKIKKEAFECIQMQIPIYPKMNKVTASREDMSWSAVEGESEEATFCDCQSLPMSNDEVEALEDENWQDRWSNHGQVLAPSEVPAKASQRQEKKVSVKRRPPYKKRKRMLLLPRNVLRDIKIPLRTKYKLFPVTENEKEGKTKKNQEKKKVTKCNNCGALRELYHKNDCPFCQLPEEYVHRFCQEMSGIAPAVLNQFVEALSTLKPGKGKNDVWVPQRNWWKVHGSDYLSENVIRYLSVGK